jgi:L-Ala-D/L-Glu epimerase
LGLQRRGVGTLLTPYPIMSPEKLADYFGQYRPQRFKYIKLKVNHENLVDFVKEVRRLCANPLMIDANEAYLEPDQLLMDLEKVGERSIEFIEQPFPSGFVTEYQYLKPKSPFPVFADESVTDEADFEILATCFHGINVKLMKAGGYLNGIRLLQEARTRGLKTMIGCMVETGLGISSGLQLASLSDYLDLDSFLILKEDLYPFVGEKGGMLFLADKHKLA